MLIGDKVEKEYICFYSEITRKPATSGFDGTQEMQEMIHTKGCHWQCMPCGVHPLARTCTSLAKEIFMAQLKEEEI